MTEETYKENWDRSRDIVRRCGLPPSPDFIPMIRNLLEAESANDRRAGNEYLRALCVLLWANGDAEDAVRIAIAKFLDFDAGCMVDEDFLACGGLAAARARLATSDHPSAQRALAWIADWTETPPKHEKLSWERTTFGVASGS